MISEAASRVAAGETLNSIARDLTRRGITAADGSGVFYTRRLKRILVNPRIAGLRAYKGEVIRDAAWPAILPRETWETVRAILNDPARGRGGHPLRWPLAGLAVCGLCKVPMRTKWAHGRVVYACDPTKPGFKGCGRVSVNALHLEQMVLRMIVARDWRHLATALLEKVAASSGDVGLAEQLAADEEHLRQVAVQYGLRQLTRLEWEAIRETLLPRIDAAHGRLQQRMALPLESLAGSESILEPWPKLTVEQKRAVLRALFHKIEVGPATRRGRGPDPDRLAPPYGPDWKV